MSIGKPHNTSQKAVDETLAALKEIQADPFRGSTSAAKIAPTVESCESQVGMALAHIEENTDIIERFSRSKKGRRTVYMVNNE